MANETDRLLDRYRRSYPVDVENLIANLGLGFEVTNLGDGISGHIKREENGYVIRVNSREHAYRQRFTMAHEVGHFILHRSILDQAGGVNDNTLYRTDIHAPAYNSHIHRVHERQANSFAANLLMPETLVRDVYNRESETSPIPDGSPYLAALYRAFQVSPSAMRWRLRTLDLDYAEPVAP